MARYFHQQIEKENTPQNINQKILLKRLLQEGLNLIERKEPQEIKSTIYSIVEDLAVALTGQQIDFLETSESPYPNGIKEGNNELINENALYSGLPPIVTTKEYDRGVVFDYNSYG